MPKSQIARIRELLKHADTVTAESRELRQHIEHIRAEEREWPREPSYPPERRAPPTPDEPDFARSSSDGMTRRRPTRP